MFKRLAQLTIIGFLLCSLPMPVEARSSSSSSSSSSRSSSPSSSSSSSSFKSSPSTTSYSRSSSTPSQTKTTTSSSSSNSQSTFGSSFNSSYSSRPVTKPAQAVTTEKPKISTTYMPEYRLPNTTGKTETRYFTIFSDSGTRTVPVVVPFGYTQPIVLPQTYYPATTTVVAGEWSIWNTLVSVFAIMFIGFVILLIIAGMR